jgi:tetratricopeptide (TPR) repeat protein
MKIGIYALARNEAGNVARWADSCREADCRVVTDTGSTDDTVAMLEAAGVTVARGNVSPWRWDHAHNLSLHHLPDDVDVAVRLDLDEAFAPGWRDGVEAAWRDRPATTKLRYWYQWSESLRFRSDRIHLRAGYHWTGATHEGLVRWHGDEVQTVSDAVRITHHRAPGKRHGTDLELLRQACREAPADARMRWYLARELDYGDDAGTVDAFKGYLDLPGGTPHERAYACRVLARRLPDEAGTWLLRCLQESPHEPEAYLLLGRACWDTGDAVGALHWCRRAAQASPDRQTHTSDPAAYGPQPAAMAATAAYSLGLKDESAAHAAEAFRRQPDDQRLAEQLARLQLELSTHTPGPRDK